MQARTQLTDMNRTAPLLLPEPRVFHPQLLGNKRLMVLLVEAEGLRRRQRTRTQPTG